MSEGYHYQRKVQRSTSAKKKTITTTTTTSTSSASSIPAAALLFPGGNQLGTAAAASTHRQWLPQSSLSPPPQDQQPVVGWSGAVDQATTSSTVLKREMVEMDHLLSHPSLRCSPAAGRVSTGSLPPAIRAPNAAGGVPAWMGTSPTPVYSGLVSTPRAAPSTRLSAPLSIDTRNSLEVSVNQALLSMPQHYQQAPPRVVSYPEAQSQLGFHPSFESGVDRSGARRSVSSPSPRFSEGQANVREESFVAGVSSGQEDVAAPRTNYSDGRNRAEVGPSGSPLDAAARLLPHRTAAVAAGTNASHPSGSSSEQGEVRSATMEPSAPIPRASTHSSSSSAGPQPPLPAYTAVSTAPTPLHHCSNEPTAVLARQHVLHSPVNATPCEFTESAMRMDMPMPVHLGMRNTDRATTTTTRTSTSGGGGGEGLESCTAADESGRGGGEKERLSARSPHRTPSSRQRSPRGHSRTSTSSSSSGSSVRSDRQHSPHHSSRDTGSGGGLRRSSQSSSQAIRRSADGGGGAFVRCSSDTLRPSQPLSRKSSAAVNSNRAAPLPRRRPSSSSDSESRGSSRSPSGERGTGPHHHRRHQHHRHRHRAHRSVRTEDVRHEASQQQQQKVFSPGSGGMGPYGYPTTAPHPTSSPTAGTPSSLCPENIYSNYSSNPPNSSQLQTALSTPPSTSLFPYGLPPHYVKPLQEDPPSAAYSEAHSKGPRYLARQSSAPPPSRGQRLSSAGTTRRVSPATRRPTAALPGRRREGDTATPLVTQPPTYSEEEEEEEGDFDGAPLHHCVRSAAVQRRCTSPPTSGDGVGGPPRRAEEERLEDFAVLQRSRSRRRAMRRWTARVLERLYALDARGKAKEAPQRRPQNGAAPSFISISSTHAKEVPCVSAPERRGGETAPAGTQHADVSASRQKDVIMRAQQQSCASKNKQDRKHRERHASSTSRRSCRSTSTESDASHCSSSSSSSKEWGRKHAKKGKKRSPSHSSFSPHKVKKHCLKITRSTEPSVAVNANRGNPTKDVVVEWRTRHLTEAARHLSHKAKKLRRQHKIDVNWQRPHGTRHSSGYGCCSEICNHLQPHTGKPYNVPCAFCGERRGGAPHRHSPSTNTAAAETPQPLFRDLKKTRARKKRADSNAAESASRSTLTEERSLTRSSTAITSSVSSPPAGSSAGSSGSAKNEKCAMVWESRVLPTRTSPRSAGVGAIRKTPSRSSAASSSTPTSASVRSAGMEPEEDDGDPQRFHATHRPEKHGNHALGGESSRTRAGSGVRDEPPSPLESQGSAPFTGAAGAYHVGERLLQEPHIQVLLQQLSPKTRDRMKREVFGSTKALPGATQDRLTNPPEVSDNTATTAEPDPSTASFLEQEALSSDRHVPPLSNAPVEVKKKQLKSKGGKRSLPHKQNKSRSPSSSSSHPSSTDTTSHGSRGSTSRRHHFSSRNRKAHHQAVRQAHSSPVKLHKGARHRRDVKKTSSALALRSGGRTARASYTPFCHRNVFPQTFEALEKLLAQYDDGHPHRKLHKSSASRRMDGSRRHASQSHHRSRSGSTGSSSTSASAANSRHTPASPSGETHHTAIHTHYAFLPTAWLHQHASSGTSGPQNTSAAMAGVVGGHVFGATAPPQGHRYLHVPSSSTPLQQRTGLPLHGVTGSSQNVFQNRNCQFTEGSQPPSTGGAPAGRGLSQGGTSHSLSSSVPRAPSVRLSEFIDSAFGPARSMNEPDQRSVSQPHTTGSSSVPLWSSSQRQAEGEVDAAPGEKGMEGKARMESSSRSPAPTHPSVSAAEDEPRHSHSAALPLPPSSKFPASRAEVGVQFASPVERAVQHDGSFADERRSNPLVGRSASGELRRSAHSSTSYRTRHAAEDSAAPRSSVIQHSHPHRTATTLREVSGGSGPAEQTGLLLEEFSGSLRPTAENMRHALTPLRSEKQLKRYPSARPPLSSSSSSLSAVVMHSLSSAQPDKRSDSPQSSGDHEKKESSARVWGPPTTVEVEYKAARSTLVPRHVSNVDEGGADDVVRCPSSSSASPGVQAARRLLEEARQQEAADAGANSTRPLVDPVEALLCTVHAEGPSILHREQHSSSCGGGRESKPTTTTSSGSDEFVGVPGMYYRYEKGRFIPVPDPTRTALPLEEGGQRVRVPLYYVEGAPEDEAGEKPFRPAIGSAARPPRGYGISPEHEHAVPYPARNDELEPSHPGCGAPTLSSRHSPQEKRSTGRDRRQSHSPESRGEHWHRPSWERARGSCGTASRAPPPGVEAEGRSMPLYNYGRSPLGCSRLNPYCKVCRDRFQLVFVDEHMAPLPVFQTNPSQVPASSLPTTTPTNAVSRHYDPSRLTPSATTKTSEALPAQRHARRRSPREAAAGVACRYHGPYLFTERHPLLERLPHGKEDENKDIPPQTEEMGAGEENDCFSSSPHSHGAEALRHHHRHRHHHSTAQKKIDLLDRLQLLRASLQPQVQRNAGDSSLPSDLPPDGALEHSLATTTPVRSFTSVRTRSGRGGAIGARSSDSTRKVTLGQFVPVRFANADGTPIGSAAERELERRTTPYGWSPVHPTAVREGEEAHERERRLRRGLGPFNWGRVAASRGPKTLAGGGSGESMRRESPEAAARFFSTKRKHYSDTN